MASESTADEAKGWMGYWLWTHLGSRNNNVNVIIIIILLLFLYNVQNVLIFQQKWFSCMVIWNPQIQV